MHIQSYGINNILRNNKKTKKNCTINLCKWIIIIKNKIKTRTETENKLIEELGKRKKNNIILNETTDPVGNKSVTIQASTK